MRCSRGRPLAAVHRPAAASKPILHLSRSFSLLTLSIHSTSPVLRFAVTRLNRSPLPDCCLLSPSALLSLLPICLELPRSAARDSSLPAPCRSPSGAIAIAIGLLLLFAAGRHSLLCAHRQLAQAAVLHRGKGRAQRQYTGPIGCCCACRTGCPGRRLTVLLVEFRLPVPKVAMTTA